MSIEEKRKKQRENVAKWRKANPEKVKELNAISHRKHREKILAHKKMKYDENPSEYQRRALKWYHAHKEKDRARRVSKYGLSLEEYIQLIEDAKTCPLCNDSFENNPRVLDHDHKSGNVRGVICRRCNSGIGFLREDVDILLNAIHYLKKGGD